MSAPSNLQSGDILAGVEHGIKAEIMFIEDLGDGILARWKQESGWGVIQTTDLRSREWKLVDHEDPSKVHQSPFVSHAEIELPANMTNVLSQLGKISRKHPKAQMATIMKNGKNHLCLLEYEKELEVEL